jgi:uncharacterized protein
MSGMNYTLITGASKGFGKALAFECASRKMNLVLVALPGSGLPELAIYLIRNYQVDIHYFEINLLDGEARMQLFDQVSEMNLNINILINNAGVGGTKLFTDGRWKLFQKQIGLNIIATTEITHLFLNNLQNNTPSYILNVGSLSSFFFPVKKQVYAGTKAYIYALSKSLRKELKPDGISVSVVCPGGMNTNLAVTLMNRSASWIARMSIMNPEKVAPIAIDGLLNGKEVIIPGRLNQLFLFLNKLLPPFLKRMISKAQMKKLKTSNIVTKYLKDEKMVKKAVSDA